MIPEIRGEGVPYDFRKNQKGTDEKCADVKRRKWA